MAKEVIKEFRATYGYTKLKDKEWLYTQLEERGIREPSHSNSMIKSLVESKHAKDPIQATRTNELSITDVERTMKITQPMSKIAIIVQTYTILLKTVHPYQLLFKNLRIILM
jgi:hypothetical protein